MRALAEIREPGKALHVYVPAKLSGRLRAEAMRRKVMPHVLVGAALQKLVDDDLFNAVFDGDSAQEVAPGWALRPNGLTQVQCAVIHLLAQHADAFGVTCLTASRIAKLIGGVTVSRIGHLLASLAAGRGLVARTDAAPNRFRPYALTEEGWRVANALGDFSPGGEGA